MICDFEAKDNHFDPKSFQSQGVTKTLLFFLENIYDLANFSGEKRCSTLNQRSVLCTVATRAARNTDSFKIHIPILRTSIEGRNSVLLFEPVRSGQV